jgi:hypothetical protein
VSEKYSYPSLSSEVLVGATDELVEELDSVVGSTEEVLDEDVSTLVEDSTVEVLED